MQATEVLNPFFGFVGKVLLAGGGLSLIVYQVFKHLSVKWLDAKFDERLQDLKHKQGKEIEELRFKIATMLDRATKLHQREFDVLPETWSKMSEAYWATGGLVASLRFFPDIDRMDSKEQEEFISGCDLKEKEKQKLRETREKNRFYQECIGWRDLLAAESKTREAAIYLAKNGIFISGPIQEKFEALRGLIWRTLVEQRMNEEHRSDTTYKRMYEEIHNYVANGDKQLKELEKLVHDRLWSVESGSAQPPAIIESAVQSQ